MNEAVYTARAPKVTRKQSAGFAMPPVQSDLFLHNDVFAVCHAPRVPHRTIQKPHAGFAAGYPPILNTFDKPDWYERSLRSDTWTEYP